MKFRMCHLLSFAHLETAKRPRGRTGGVLELGGAWYSWYQNIRAYFKSPRYLLELYAGYHKDAGKGQR